MILWVLLTLMIAVTVVGLTAPLVRRAETRPGRGATLGVLKEQLRDLDARDGAEAEGLRTEIKRRILAEGREEAAPSRPFADKTLRRLAVGLAAVVALASAGLYATMGRPDLVAGAPVGNAESPSARGESLVQAANGTVTPPALNAFNAALAVDPADPRARYYVALHKDQQGDAKGAVEDWIALLNDAPSGAAWAVEVRAVVERTAAERGIDVSGRLPAAAQPDQQAMIRGMVEGLDARLRANPGDADGWVRLMRSRMVLGETDKAAAAYRDARMAFAKDAEQLAALQQAARELKVPGA